MVASRTASHRKKLNSHADSTKLVKPSRRFARQLRPASDDALLLLLDNGRTAVLPAANCEAPTDNQTYAEFKYITCI